MSRLVHLCTNEACGHPKAAHNTIGAVYKSCPCCRRDPRDVEFDPEPVLLPTFDLATYKPEPLWQPGDVRNAGTGHKEQLCGCDACHAAYVRETA